MQIRQYQPGDEEGISNIIVESFSGFRKWGLTPEKWLGYEVDPGFRKENAFVAEENGEIVGHVQVVSRDLNFGRYVKVAGVANVCTKPGDRNRGIATDLMNEVLDYSSRSYNLSALDTGYASTPHRIYRRVGYSPFHVFRYFVGERWEIERTLKRLEKISDGYESVREFQSGDKGDIEKIYEANSKEIRGSYSRPQKYWEEKLFKRNSWHTFFYRPFNPKDVLVLPGRAYAYLDWEEDFIGHIPHGFSSTDQTVHRKLFIREFLARPDDRLAMAAVLKGALALCAGCNEVVVLAPENDPWVDYLLADFYQLRAGDDLMVKVLNPKGLMEEIFGVGEGAGPRVQLRLYDDESFLEPVNLELASLAPVNGQAEARIGMYQSDFVGLLSGLADPLGLLGQGKMAVAGDDPVYVARAMRNALKQSPFYLWMSDHWRCEIWLSPPTSMGPLPNDSSCSVGLCVALSSNILFNSLFGMADFLT